MFQKGIPVRWFVHLCKPNLHFILSIQKALQKPSCFRNPLHGILHIHLVKCSSFQWPVGKHCMLNMLNFEWDKDAKQHPRHTCSQSHFCDKFLCKNLPLSFVKLSVGEKSGKPLSCFGSSPTSCNSVWTIPFSALLCIAVASSDHTCSGKLPA